MKSHTSLYKFVLFVQFLLFCLSFLALQAQNPFVTHIYTADPTARVFDGKLYVYPSHDVSVCHEEQGSNGFCMPDYHIFSTEDMVNWTDHGMAIDQNDVPWGEKDMYGMWAPDCIEKDGKYYYYYPAIPKDKSAFRRIGVAISDSPTGPFKHVENYIDGVKGIDPGVFIDDDGKGYLYFGGGKGIGALKAAPLKDNMVEINAPPIAVEGIHPDGYREASFLFKKNGIYYFTYARAGENNYEIEYGISDNPLGPFEYKGVIMPNIGNGTNHHSIVEYKGDWYIFYHYWSLSGNNRLRSIRADKITFNPDGTIEPKEATLRGIGAPKAGDIIEIDRYNEIKGVQVHPVKGNQPRGFQVDFIKDGGYVRFDRVDFGEGQLKNLFVRAANGNTAKGTMELHIDSPEGPLLATVEIKPTGSWESWETFTSKFTNQATGIHDIYTVFRGGEAHVANVNWIKFSSAAVPGSALERPYEKAGAPVDPPKNKLVRILTEEEKKIQEALKKKGIPIDQRITLRSDNGQYISVRFDEENAPLKVNQQQARKWEQFRPIAVSKDKIALKAMANLHFVSVRSQEKNTPLLSFHKGTPETSELFSWEQINDTQIALKTPDGRWVSVDDSNPEHPLTTVKKKKPSANELFTIAVLEDK